MPQGVDVNKINKAQERHAEHLSDKFEKKGMGQDVAKNRALEEVAREPNTGGGNAGGDAKKG